ncbi:energy transducer TonB [Sphingomicrobium lutaoense]|uniref:Protein TonB n=1 Tax=Sphingomicrobium lutaoense TaxID=515949 RepID=A0A839YYH4_9SPHN|nr:energy transducer TonB [Sphingomicrobium lutaoense]MBB3763368.1 protein TonB [Sphingomicrobium lutaoense]
MSYVNRKQMSGNRPLAIALVALVTITLGYALVSGLAYNVVKKTVEDLKTFDVEDEPPPPPEEPPPPPEQQPVEVPPPVVAPPPIVRTNVAPPPIVSTPVAPPPVITPTAPVTPPAPPAPPPPRIEPAQPRGDLRSLFSTDDYPSRALRNGDEGTVVARLTVGTNGRVQDCQITRSSGSSALDSQTCRILERRARFTPATDDKGAKVVGTVTTPSIRWQIPE